MGDWVFGDYTMNSTIRSESPSGEESSQRLLSLNKHAKP
jgi:hypothetical protein